MTVNLVTLHGFLGAVQDFQTLIGSLQAQIGPKLVWTPIDYYKEPQLSPEVSWQEWPQHFERYLDQIPLSGSTNFLLGYSQGGRLALNYLKSFLGRSPHQWRGLILISSGLGLSELEKVSRLDFDQKWSNKFLTEDFQEVVEQWNQLPIFSGSQREPQRLEKDFNRKLLAKNLINWSPSQHESYFNFLSNLELPICYLAGESDKKYVEIGQDLAKKNSKVQLELIESAGHRCFLDQPEVVGLKILDFIKIYSAN
jgi:2-succinyl-6-hydroxy-2,4-cyclohexadiene-1-carboxylate synthase